MYQQKKEEEFAKIFWFVNQGKTDISDRGLRASYWPKVNLKIWILLSSCRKSIIIALWHRAQFHNKKTNTLD